MEFIDISSLPHSFMPSPMQLIASSRILDSINQGNIFNSLPEPVSILNASVESLNSKKRRLEAETFVNAKRQCIKKKFRLKITPKNEEYSKTANVGYANGGKGVIFSCFIGECRLKTYSKEALQNHVKKFHDENEMKKINCEMCQNFKIKSIEDEIKHLTSHIEGTLIPKLELPLKIDCIETLAIKEEEELDLSIYEEQHDASILTISSDEEEGEEIIKQEPHDEPDNSNDVTIAFKEEPKADSTIMMEQSMMIDEEISGSNEITMINYNPNVAEIFLKTFIKTEKVDGFLHPADVIKPTKIYKTARKSTTTKLAKKSNPKDLFKSDHKLKENLDKILEEVTKIGENINEKKRRESICVERKVESVQRTRSNSVDGKSFECSGSKTSKTSKRSRSPSEKEESSRELRSSKDSSEKHDEVKKSSKSSRHSSSSSKSTEKLDEEGKKSSRSDESSKRSSSSSSRRKSTEKLDEEARKTSKSSKHSSSRSPRKESSEKLETDSKKSSRSSESSKRSSSSSSKGESVKKHDEEAKKTSKSSNHSSSRSPSKKSSENLVEEAKKSSKSSESSKRSSSSSSRSKSPEKLNEAKKSSRSSESSKQTSSRSESSEKQIKTTSDPVLESKSSNAKSPSKIAALKELLSVEQSFVLRNALKDLQNLAEKELSAKDKENQDLQNLADKESSPNDKENQDNDDLQISYEDFTSKLNYESVKNLFPWIDAKVTSQILKTKTCHDSLLSENSLFSTFKCMSQTCNFFTTDLDDFKQHLKSYIDVKHFCSFCLKSFDKPDELCTHIDSTHKFDRLQCSKCMFRACQKGYVEIHQKEFHKSEKNLEIFKSPVQVLLKKERNEAIANLKVNREKFVMPFKCRTPNCYKIFFSKNNFKLHLHSEASKPSNQAHSSIICEQLYEVNSVKTNNTIHGNTQCLFCKFGNDFESVVLEHMAKNHPSNIAYVCKRKIRSDVSDDKSKMSNRETFESHTTIEYIGDCNVKLKEFKGDKECLKSNKNLKE